MIRIAFVGLGRRGLATLRRHLALDHVEVAALCDSAPEALAEASALAPSAELFSSWEAMLASGLDARLVYISTDWATHAPIAIAAMREGYDVAVEVPAATNAEEGRRLIEAVKQTGRFFTMVENCCYDPFHLSTIALARDGILGEITHCEGAYIHDLRDEIKAGRWQAHAIAENHANPYPTHGLGPMCQILGIGFGGCDRMKEIVSMSPADAPGINSSLISTERGRTMLLQYDTITPRPYSRLQTVCGRRGYISKYPVEMAMLDGATEPITGETLASLFAAHPHPLLEAYRPDGLRKGVGNMMNYIMDRRIVDLLRTDAAPDITVEDAVLWSSIAWLSKASAAGGSQPVAVPTW